MKLSKREREQVVELLRCAADWRPGGHGVNGMLGTGYPPRDPVERLAWDALDASRAACGYVPDAPDYSYQADLLEAAQRVEEGSWP